MNKTVLNNFFLFIGIIFLFFCACTIKNIVTETLVNPLLSQLLAPDTVYLQSDARYPVSVRVTDPQGWEDIQTVQYFIFLEGNTIPVWEDTLIDDGTGGDIIPHDGIFFDSLTVDFAEGNAGEYRLGVIAEDVSSNVSDTLFVAITVVDGVKNLPPALSNPVVPDTLTSETLGDVFLSVQAGDPQGLDDIDSVLFQIYPPWSPTSYFEGDLRDDGTGGDAVAGDGVFSYQGDLRDTLRTGGDHSLRFQAVDRGGLRSDALVVEFYVNLGNEPPVLSNVSAPDTVSRSASSPFLLSVQVDDPQGQADVKLVYFDSTKPDGTPAEGNPFVMFDDGTSGDLVPGDGVYSLTVTITPQNDTGVYRFDFFAEDYSGAVSDPLIHNIIVVD